MAAAPDAHALPLFEGVTLCLLTAVSFLALVVILAVIPRRFVWRSYVRTTGDRCR